MEVKTKSTYQPYPKYKDTGIKWLRKIPEHWELLRGNYIFKRIDERSSNGEEELLSVSEIHGVRPRSGLNVYMFKAENYAGYKLCYPGDLVINSLWAWSRGLAISDYFGIVSTAYSVLRPDHVGYDKAYLNYLLRTPRYVAKYNIESRGIWKSRLQISDWSFLRIPIITPPKPEQTRIANLLDHKCEQIDKAIAQKERLIELLKERRQIIIQNAVTRGLNSNVKLKDSGVEWIGKIPEHWEVKRLKYISSIKSGDTIINNYISDKGLYEVFGGNGFMGFTNKFNVSGEQIIIGRVGALCGNIRYSNKKRWISDNALILKLQKGELYDFYKFLLSIADLNKLNTSNAQPLITGTKVMNLSIPYPPNEEQRKMVNYIESQSKRIEQLINNQQTQIEKLKEYKTVLIDSAVTGKIKVS